MNDRDLPPELQQPSRRHEPALELPIEPPGEPPPPPPPAHHDDATPPDPFLRRS